MKLKSLALGACATLAVGSAFAGEGPVPTGVPTLNHVFIIMMENHSIDEVIGNPNAPVINRLAATENFATNYFGIAHPSLNNYLEVVGGSNFGVHSDNYPDWHNAKCKTNLATGVPSTDNPASPAICPIAGSGTDAAVPAIDYTNEFSGKPGTYNIDGVKSIPAAKGTLGKTIADQLVKVGKTWASFQEDLPVTGADLIDISDGTFSNLTDFTTVNPQLNPPLTSSDIVALYAVKHNPFAYFRNVQEGADYNLSLNNIVGFEGGHGLYADLANGALPTFSFIAPNQCNDQHGRGNSTAFCNYDPQSNGTQAGLNPALVQQADLTVERLVNTIKNSPVWAKGQNAIVVVWDENDYGPAPETNKVPAIVIKNYGSKGVKSSNYYTHFSLLKSIEAGLHLPCLNHACDADTAVMSDLFQ